MTDPTPNPREVFLEGRRQARSGQILYDGAKFPISFDLPTQQRVEKLAAAWRVPRAEMVRYLVSAALQDLEAIQPPAEDPIRKEGTS